MRFGVLGFVLLLSCELSSAAQSVSNVHTFNIPDGSNVLAGIIQARDGNFYGTANGGGANSLGTVFRISPTGEFSVLHSFTGGPDGDAPAAPLIEGPDGNFYGTTQYGGDRILCSATGGCGTVFRITPTGSLATLYNFRGNSDGSHPQSGLVLGADGAFYGATAYGGDAASDGTLFRVALDGTYTQLHQFNAATDGAQPEATLVEVSPGVFYGTAAAGGDQGLGTIFNISASGRFARVYSFSPSSGAAPTNRLFEANDGNLYGTTQKGGNLGACNGGCGTLFRINQSGSLASLLQFVNDSTGSRPLGDLFAGSDGNLYGTTSGQGGCSAGQPTGCGTIFSFAPSGAFQTVFATSPGSGLVGSYGGLIQSDSGEIWGTTAGALQITGLRSSSTIYRFELDPELGPPVVLTFDHPLVSKNSSTQLSWKVLNAASTSMQQCFASIQNSPAGAGTWTGQQSGVLAAGTYSGATIITPTEDCTYTYALTCGGIESGFATLTVGTPSQLSIATTNLPAGTVGSPYAATVAATGGFGAYTWTIEAGRLPVGLTLNPKTGVISGVPSEAGSVAFSVRVSDSQDTPATAAASLLISIGQATPSFVASVLPAKLEIGQTTMFHATLTGPQGVSDPAGTVQFKLNGANAGSPVSLSGGAVAILSSPFQTPGAYVLTADYSGDANYHALTSAAFSFVVTTITPQVMVALQPAQIIAGGATDLTATVTGRTGAENPSGTVQFMVNGANLGSPVALSNGLATLANQQFQLGGTYSITAAYSGDANYSGAQSNSATLTVSAVAAILSANPDTINIAMPGGSGGTTLSVFHFESDSIKFSCSGLPVSATCTFGKLQGNGSLGTAQLRIATSAPYSSKALAISTGRSGVLYALMFPALVPFIEYLRRRRLGLCELRRVGIFSLMFFALLLSGCGVHFNGTTAGTYPIKVVATAGSQTASATVSLVVSK